MKKSILLVAFTLFTCLAFAQKYSFVKELNEVALKVYPGQNGSFYTLSIEPNCPDDIAVLRFYNAQGTVGNKFQSPGYIGDINDWDAVVTPTNHIVLYLRLDDINELLYEFDSAGTMIWNYTLQYTAPVVKFTKLLAAPGGYYLLGNTIQANNVDSNRAVLAKIDLAGHHVWVKTFQANTGVKSSTMYNDMIVDNNKLILVGRYYNTAGWTGQMPFRPILSVLDTGGNLQQSYYYMLDSSQFIGFTPFEFVKIDKTPGGNYYVVANDVGNEHNIVKLNSSFNMVWEKKRLSGKALAFAAGYNEDLFVVPDGSTKNAILQLDSNGNSVAAHALKRVAGSYIHLGHVIAIKKHDCGFIVSGDYNMYAHTDKDMQYCLDSVMAPSTMGNYYDVTGFYRGNRTMLTGLLNAPYYSSSTLVYSSSAAPSTSICSQTYTCTSTEDHEAVNNTRIAAADIYPNPAADVVRVTLPDPGTAYSLTMYDVSGKQVLQSTLQNSKEYTLHLPSLATGFYTVRIVGDGNVYVKKLQIIQ